MKKGIRIHPLILAAVMVVSSCFFGVTPSFAATTVVVDPAAQYQTMEGWGTSLCWFGNKLGGWSDTKRNAVADLLFGSSGLGLNIVRYNIGGGENPSHEHMRSGGEMPGFEPSQGVWDWTADANQRWFLSAAKSRGANITEAFSNSPPYWMTVSQCASGSTDGTSNNLKDTMYTEFANYLTEVVKHFRDSWGITFTTLEPLNESVSGWWKANGSQEGCHFDTAKQNQIIKEVYSQLASKGLTGTKVSAMDESSLDDAVTSFNSYDSTAKSNIYQLNTHTYGGSNRIGVRNTAAANGKKLWMSEVDSGGGTAHNHNDIIPGIDLAKRIKQDLNELQPVAWVHWQAVENEQNMQRENSNWGLIHADFENGGENYYTTKKYYTMGNYTKFIKPGYKIIGTNNSNLVAAFNSTTSTLVLVATNDTTSSVSYTFDMTGFTSVGTTATPYRTSSTENLAQLSNISVSNKSFTATANANSVTTYVISGVTYNNAIVKVNDSQFTYVGSWSYGAQTGAYTSDNHWTGTANNYYQVAFNGTQVKIYGAKANNHGIVAVSIDGGAETNVDFYASTRSDNVLIYTSPTLTSGNHTLKVRVTGTKNGSSSGYAIPADRVDIYK